MTKFKYLLYLLLLLPKPAFSQNDTIKYEIGISGIVSNGKYSPFWLQSNQYGKTSSNPNSANQLEGISKDYGNGINLYDYGFKANILIKSDNNKSEVYLHEIYLKQRLSVFEIIIGAREEHLGNQDSTLSSGGFLFSTNARPIPKITIGVEHFTPMPYTKGHIEFKGALSDGIFIDDVYMQNKLFHHKYLYLKLGAKYPVNFQIGLDHTAIWGGNLPNQKNTQLGIKDYKNVFFTSGGGTNTDISEQINTEGDHRISQSMKMEAKVNGFTLGAYWQNFSEDGPVRFITNAINIPDGLWGISLRNKKIPFINAIVYEYLNTTDQSGNIFQKDGIIYGGIDNYFNNGIYQSGWNNYYRTIGTPFITSPIYNSNKSIQNLNNRVQVHHIGIEGSIAGFEYRTLCSFSKNYGSYGEPYVPMKENLSSLLEVKKHLQKFSNIDAGISVSSDRGELYGNSIGFQFSIRKTGNLFK